MSKDGCVGSYSVSGYTRADGTQVSSYIRRCGAAHISSDTTSNHKEEDYETPVFKLGIEYNEERKPKKRAKWLEKYLKTQEEHHAKMINRANLFYPNMPETKQLEIEKILEAGKNELADIEKERKLAHAKNIAGAALEIGSAFIPGVNGLKATTTIAKALTPLVGKKIAATTAKNAIDGALLSSVYGLGEGLLEDKNLIENTVDNAMLGGITGGVFGLGFGRLKKHIAKSKILSNPENKELVDEFIIDYVDGLINKKQALAEARGLELTRVLILIF